MLPGRILIWPLHGHNAGALHDGYSKRIYVPFEKLYMCKVHIPLKTAFALGTNCHLSAKFYVCNTNDYYLKILLVKCGI